MSPERRREIASKGGSSIPAEKRSFSQNRELAVMAGRKGGSVSHPQSRNFNERDPQLAKAAGRKGGLS